MHKKYNHNLPQKLPETADFMEEERIKGIKRRKEGGKREEGRVMTAENRIP